MSGDGTIRSGSAPSGIALNGRGCLCRPEIDHLVILVVDDRRRVFFALHTLDRRAHYLPNAEGEHIHHGMPCGPAGTWLVPDLVLVDVSPVTAFEQGRPGRSA